MPVKSFTLQFKGYWLEPDINGLASSSGIYCVYACKYDDQNDKVSIRDLLYIGEAKNVQSRVAKHEQKNDWKRELNRGEELCFSFALIQPIADRERVEAAMIYQHTPVCNDHYVNWFPFDQTSIQTKGMKALLKQSFTIESSI